MTSQEHWKSPPARLSVQQLHQLNIQENIAGVLCREPTGHRWVSRTPVTQNACSSPHNGISIIWVVSTDLYIPPKSPCLHSILHSSQCRHTEQNPLATDPRNNSTREPSQGNRTMCAIHFLWRHFVESACHLFSSQVKHCSRQQSRPVRRRQFRVFNSDKMWSLSSYGHDHIGYWRSNALFGTKTVSWWCMLVGAYWE